MNYSENDINSIQQGALAVFATDSSYGIGGVYDNEALIERVLSVKQRTDRKFTLVASSLEQVLQEFPEMPEKARELAKQHWPGPLSIAWNEQFSIRVPAYEALRELAQQVGKPLIATSANISGQDPAFTLQEAKDALGETNVDVWIDGGKLQQTDPSTVVAIQGDEVNIVRQGPVTV